MPGDVRFSSNSCSGDRSWPEKASLFGVASTPCFSSNGRKASHKLFAYWLSLVSPYNIRSLSAFKLSPSGSLCMVPTTCELHHSMCRLSDQRFAMSATTLDPANNPSACLDCSIPPCLLGLGDPHQTHPYLMQTEGSVTCASCP